ncbi:elongation factor P maturation arginine rhamnosyltransferase EarP [Undibacterium arcticum]|uniref:Protein-arginine rhamnosyltransferase n=1 Tax=Undibacterium arcticum TaxID=1762892 RepID=A0ABV7F7Z0_9BURK
MDSMAGPQTLALFCSVADNYGDIGVCWRLTFQSDVGVIVGYVRHLAPWSGTGVFPADGRKKTLRKIGSVFSHR